MKKLFRIGSLILALSFVASSCYKEEFVEVEDWTTASHSSSATPDYSIVFDDAQVNRLDLTIESSDWKDMQNDLEDVLSGNSSGGGGTTTFSDETPMYVPCDMEFNGVTWPHVGVRYKGNSSLEAYNTGANKLPLRLEIDKFDNDYPEITGMRFYGFKELSLSSNYNDESLLREKVAPDLFRSFGVPAPRTAFYEVYIDYGDGSVYFGVYTMIEVVFDTPMLESLFDNSTGNCYKPDGDGAQFNTADFNLDDIEIKNNDFSDKTEITEFHDILHSSSRQNDSEKWREEMNASFDVQGYLKYLAVNTTIQNWDTYGVMTHNYYLYHDPTDDLIKWIPWDNNEAFQTGKQGGALSFSYNETSGSEWPIIKFILADEEYEKDYLEYLEQFSTEIFNTNNMTVIYNEQKGIVSESAEKEQSGYTYLSNGDISTAVATLINHATSRNSSALNYVDSQ